MKKKSILYVLIIAIFATVLMGCDLSLDVPPHDWMIGNWTDDATGNSTLEITASNIVINYEGDKFDLGVAGFFVNITETRPSDTEYLITYKDGSNVTKFKFTEGLTSSTMNFFIDEDGYYKPGTIYNKQ